LREILDAAAARHVTVREDDRERLDALATDHRGVVARISAPAALGERELASFAFEDDALVVVLDGIEDPHNLGAAARAAEAAGASMLVSRTRRAADVTEAAVRASAGALLHLPHARVANVTRALERLKVVGFTVAGLSEDADASIYEESPPEGRVAIVLGSEGTGMSRLVREACDVVVGLPMLGEVRSLNASTSLAAVLYAWVLASRRRPSGPATGSTFGECREVQLDVAAARHHPERRVAATLVAESADDLAEAAAAVDPAVVVRRAALAVDLQANRDARPAVVHDPGALVVVARPGPQRRRAVAGLVGDEVPRLRRQGGRREESHDQRRGDHQLAKHPFPLLRKRTCFVRGSM
jgi:23S rRNA (guanosine2251-2'-O)-methyltransferase